MKRTFQVGSCANAPNHAVRDCFDNGNENSGCSDSPLVQTAAAQYNGQGQPQNCSNRTLSGRYAYDVQGRFSLRRP